MGEGRVGISLSGMGDRKLAGVLGKKSSSTRYWPVMRLWSCSAQAALDQAAQDLLPEVVRELAGDPGPDDAVLVQPDVDRDGDAGVARVGLQADARDLAHGYAAEDHGRPDVEAAHRAVEVQDVFDVVTEHASAAQQDDARHQQRQSADDESPYSGFE